MILIEIDYLEKKSSLSEAEFEVLKYEFKDGFNDYLASGNAKVKALKVVIDFNSANEDKAMPYFKQELLESSNAKADLKLKNIQKL